VVSGEVVDGALNAGVKRRIPRPSKVSEGRKRAHDVLHAEARRTLVSFWPNGWKGADRRQPRPDPRSWAPWSQPGLEAARVTGGPGPGTAADPESRSSKSTQRGHRAVVPWACDRPIFATRSWWPACQASKRSRAQVYSCGRLIGRSAGVR